MEYRSKIRTLLFLLTLFIALGCGTVYANPAEPNTTATSLTGQTPVPFSTLAADQLAYQQHHTQTQLPAHSKTGLHLDENPLVTDRTGWGRWLAMVINITIGLAVFFGLYIVVTRWRSPLRSFRKS